MHKVLVNALFKPRILSLFPNSFNKFNKHEAEHLCKILYIFTTGMEICTSGASTEDRSQMMSRTMENMTTMMSQYLTTTTLEKTVGIFN